MAESCPLTPRQLRILRHVAEGRTNREIGRLLGGVSEDAVKSDLQLARRTIGARDRTHAVVLAHQHGWQPIPAVPTGGPQRGATPAR